MLKTQRIMIAVLIAVFAVLAAAYFIVVRPMTAPEETQPETLVTDAGEGEAYNVLLMFPQVRREDMASIEIHNDYGTYKFVYDKDAKDFILEGHERLARDAEKISALVVNTGTTYALRKLSDHATDEELEDFGLSDAADPAYYKITTNGGDVHTVKIGERIISGGGYYAMYEGRDAIYVLSASFEETVLAPVESLLSPMLTAGVSSKEYYKIDNFSIKHYGEDFLTCRNLTSAELAEMETSAIADAVSVFPGEYQLSTYYDKTLQTLAAYEGEEVVAIDLTPENLEKYGLADEPYVISYEYDGYKFRLVASEPVDGYYYVSTSAFEDIIKVPEADFDFLSWGLLRWVESSVFSRSITFVKEISVHGGDVDETFHLTHHPNDDPNLVVIGDVCGQIANVRNFREFYKTLLLVSIEGEAPEGVTADEDKCMLKFSVTTNGGQTTEYGFYRYSTRRCLLTVNGSSSFYVLADDAEKVISDADKAMKGIEINATDKN